MSGLEHIITTKKKELRRRHGSFTNTIRSFLKEDPRSKESFLLNFIRHGGSYTIDSFAGELVYPIFKQPIQLRQSQGSDSSMRNRNLELYKKGRIELENRIYKTQEIAEQVLGKNALPMLENYAEGLPHIFGKETVPHFAINHTLYQITGSERKLLNSSFIHQSRIATNLNHQENHYKVAHLLARPEIITNIYSKLGYKSPFNGEQRYHQIHDLSMTGVFKRDVLSKFSVNDRQLNAWKKLTKGLPEKYVNNPNENFLEHIDDNRRKSVGKKISRNEIDQITKLYKIVLNNQELVKESLPQDLFRKFEQIEEEFTQLRVLAFDHDYDEDITKYEEKNGIILPKEFKEKTAASLSVVKNPVYNTNAQTSKGVLREYLSSIQEKELEILTKIEDQRLREKGQSNEEFKKLVYQVYMDKIISYTKAAEGSRKYFALKAKNEDAIDNNIHMKGLEEADIWKRMTHSGEHIRKELEYITENNCTNPGVLMGTRRLIEAALQNLDMAIDLSFKGNVLNQSEDYTTILQDQIRNFDAFRNYSKTLNEYLRLQNITSFSKEIAKY